MSFFKNISFHFIISLIKMDEEFRKYTDAILVQSKHSLNFPWIFRWTRSTKVYLRNFLAHFITKASVSGRWHGGEKNKSTVFGTEPKWENTIDRLFEISNGSLKPLHTETVASFCHVKYRYHLHWYVVRFYSSYKYNIK
jgi:hypothetical protein